MDLLTQLEDLVLDVSTTLFDSAFVASTRTKEIRLSLDVLSALSPTTSPVRAKAQKDFIESSCRLTSFKIKSTTRPGGQLITPKEIRETQDKMDLVARMLATQEDAYRSPELVLDIANRLCALPHHHQHDENAKEGLTPVGEKTMIEARTLAMLADAAISAEDFEVAMGFAQRLVDKVAILRTRSSSSSTSSSASSKMLEAALELGWKTCFQLSKHPLWEDTPSRISMLAHAMTLCPASQLGGMLRMWQELDKRLVREVEEGKSFASTKKAAAAASAAGWLGGPPGVGGRGMSDLISAQTAASVGAGLVGTAANLLPLSFSPLSYFGSTPASGNTTTASTSAGRAGVATREEGGQTGEKVDARTAKLFDFDSVSGASSSSHTAGAAGGGGYVDPAERAVRAARAARDFLGWKTDQRHSPSNSERDAEERAQGQGQGQGFGGFSLSRGVEWLIGEGGERR